MNVGRLSPLFQARLAGVCYLATIAVGVFDHLVVGRKVIVAGDPAATVERILASAWAYRLAFALDLLPIYALVTVLLYQLLRPVSRSVSLLAAFLSLLGGAVGSAAAVFQLAPVAIVEGAPAARAFSAEQQQAVVMLCLTLHDIGFTISLMFFGFYCLLLGGLIMASTFMPRVVGLLMVMGGAAYATYSFTDFVSPSLAARLASWTLVIGPLGEVALTVWLLAFGVNVARWKATAAESAVASAHACGGRRSDEEVPL